METSASFEARSAPSSYPTLPLPNRANRFSPTRMEPGPEEKRASLGKRTDPRRGVPATKGDRRRQGRVGEQSYEPIVPLKVGNRRAPERGGHDTHWREGGNR
jgi:hypothetical protein